MLASQFAELAKQDARAARLLYSRHLYGLSAFHCQQGVEKATKAVALLMGLIEPSPEHLVKVVGHNSLNAVILSLADFVELTITQWDATMKAAKESADFDKGVTLIDSVYAQILESYIKGANDPEEALKRENEVKKIPTMRERFEQTQVGIDKSRDVPALRRQLATARDIVQSRKGYLWRSTMGLEPNEGIDTTISSLRTQASQAEEGLKGIKMLKTMKMTKLLSDPEHIFYFSHIQGMAFQMALNMAVLTMWHEEAPRYPPVRDSDYWIFNPYTKDTKLVRLLPELTKWTVTYCEAAYQGSQAVLAHYRKHASVT
jgi:HEPN domain-containing protein